MPDAPPDWRDILLSATGVTSAADRDRPVCVVGAGNSAGQGALYYARYASSVTILVRASALEDSMSQYLVQDHLPRREGRPRGWKEDRDPSLVETDLPGVFAVGDVRAGSGKRVAAAVGEGSACVSMVHAYLATV